MCLDLWRRSTFPWTLKRFCIPKTRTKGRQAGNSRGYITCLSTVSALNRARFFVSSASLTSWSRLLPEPDSFGVTEMPAVCPWTRTVVDVPGYSSAPRAPVLPPAIRCRRQRSTRPGDVWMGGNGRGAEHNCGARHRRRRLPSVSQSAGPLVQAWSGGVTPVANPYWAEIFFYTHGPAFYPL
jgi:hypothetical protein